MQFEAAIWRGGELLTEAQLVYVYAHPKTKVSTAIPEKLVTLFQDFEAGKPVTPTHARRLDAAVAPRERGAHGGFCRRAGHCPRGRVGCHGRPLHARRGDEPF